MPGWYLVVLLVMAVVFIVAATARLKLHPFLVLLAAAYGFGLLGEVSPGDTVAGLAAAVPVLIAIYLFADWIGDRIRIDPEAMSINGGGESEEVAPEHWPAPWRAFLPILLPIGLIAINSLAALPAAPFGKGRLQGLLTFLGDPNGASPRRGRGLPLHCEVAG